MVKQVRPDAWKKNRESVFGKDFVEKHPSKTFKIKGRSTSSKIIAIISDLHVGMWEAICSKDMPYPKRANQVILRSHWEYCIDTIGRCELLLVNGESVNGPNKKSLGYENWTSDMNEQVGDSVPAVKEWKYDDVAVTLGSDYHIREGQTNFDETFARQIGALRWGEHGNFSDMVIDFEVHGKLFNCCHHVKGSTWPAYVTTPLAREGLGMSINNSKFYRNGQHVDVMVRSHRHYHVMTRFAHSILVVTPCWQLLNSYQKKGGLGGTYPSIGAVAFIVESNGKIQMESHIIEDANLPKAMVHRI